MSNRPTSLPLQTKVSTALAVLIGVFIVASYLILNQIIAPAFNDLEMTVAHSDLKRAEMAIQTDLEVVEAVTADWAPWDDMYSYVSGENPGFLRSNLNRATLDNLGLDFLMVYSTESRPTWGMVIIEAAEADLDELGISLPNHPAAALLASHSNPESKITGLVATDLGPALISSQPVLRSDYSGPVAGAVIMGQFLNDARLERLRERTGVDMRWVFEDTGGALPGSDGDSGFDVDATSIMGHTVLSDILGARFMVLRSVTPRSISALGGQTVGVALLFLAVAGILVMGAVWLLLRAMILGPIEGLAQHMTKIRKSGDLSHRMVGHRDDEIGALASQFDDLTGEVHEARRALLDQSFKAGKADTAAEVLHNIRNAMTPMINGLERLSKAVGVTGKLRVEEATKELASTDCPPGRRDKLLQYIDASFQHVAIVGASAAEDLDIVTGQARQIEGIVSDQEKFANVVPVVEVLKVDDVLGEAANIIPKGVQPGVDLDIPTDLASYSIQAHRIGVLQVLCNLILNAYESIQRRKVPEGHIRFEVAPESVEDRSMVRLTISDNGTGFDEGTCERIFQRGFTSKTKGETTGLGLHWCANAVRGMGGSISAESRGLGQGAEFHVLLPAAQGV